MEVRYPGGEREGGGGGGRGRGGGGGRGRGGGGGWTPGERGWVQYLRSSGNESATYANGVGIDQSQYWREVECFDQSDYTYIRSV